MPNRLRYSRDLRKIPPRHGKRGYVRVTIDVEPATRDAYVARAERERVPMVALMREALTNGI